MRLLVVGATGFLGNQVCEAAEARGMTVVPAARSIGPDRPHRHRIDLTGDRDRIAELLADSAPDVVVNAAGAVSGQIGGMTAVNVTGTAALIRSMLAVTPGARLVHLGSAAEYGAGEPGVPVTEQAPLMPVGGYGATKLAGTRLVELASAVGLDSIVLRVFNPVGAGAPTTSLPGGLAAKLRTALAGGDEVRLGPLGAVRDFVDARDVADAVLVAATVAGPSHRVFNIGSGIGRPVRELVKELVAISGYQGTVHEDAAGSTRSADVPWQCADIRLASQGLGWSPHRTFTESLVGLWATGRRAG